MEKTVVALFDNLDTAQAAVQQLLDYGISRDDISVVRTNQQGDYTSGNMIEGSDHDASGAAAGAGIGAVLGGLAGLLVGLGALAIPGIGPVIAAGPIATTLAGAGLGAATGGLVGALADAGIPETDVGAYAEGVRRGGTLVTVRADEDQVSQATEILNRFTPVDINQRADEWQASGWTGNDTHGGPYSTSAGAPHTRQAEELSKGKSASTDWSQSPDYRASTGFTGENSGGTYEGSGSAGYTGAGTTYEGSGTFTSNTQPADPRESLSHPGTEQGAQDVRTFSHEAREVLNQDYDRTIGDMSRGFETYDPDFRNDWEQSYRSTGYGYERYQPAYQYGYNLATDSKYRSHEWSDIESDARRDWEMRHPNDAWEDFKGAIQHAWSRVRGGVEDALD